MQTCSSFVVSIHTLLYHTYFSCQMIKTYYTIEEFTEWPANHQNTKSD